MADFNPSIVKIVESQRKALLAREYKTVQGIMRAYEKAERSIVKELKRVQAKLQEAYAAGAPVSLAWVYQEARLENLVREVRLRLDDFSKDAIEFTANGREDAYKLGAIHAVKLGEASVYGDFAGLHAGAFETLQHTLHRSSPLAFLFESIAPTGVTVAREVFAEAIAKGYNPRKTARLLKGKIEGLARDRAVLIARTESIRAYRMATQETFQANTDILRGWRWTSARSPATCPMCIAMDGEVFPAGSLMESHPACRCAMVPLPNTDFPGPKLKSSEEWFQGLPPKEQDRILGKTKGAMYRRGDITLKDNVRWHEDPEWGRSPRSRTIKELQELHSTGALPSQVGAGPLSGYTPPPARSLADVLATPSAVKVKVKTPEEAALEKWDAQKANGKERKIGLPSVRGKKYEGPLDLTPFMDDASAIEDHALADLLATRDYANDAKVRAYIEALGDGPDLPWVVRHEGKLYIHNGDGVARLEAKRLLGQERANVRVFDSTAFNKGPVEEAKAALHAAGVKAVTIQVGTEAEVLDALDYALQVIKETGVVPPEVYVTSGTYTLSGDLYVGPRATHVAPFTATQEQLRDAVRMSKTITSPLAKDDIVDFKTSRFAFVNSTDKEVRTELLLSKMNLDDSDEVKDAIYEWGKSHYDLASLRMFDGALDQTYSEALGAYMEDSYRLGSLPEAIEKPMLKEFEKILGKRNVLPAHGEEERIIGLKTGGQGGSNPGGTYLGRDGVSRYVKFYPQADRAEVEHVANALYRFLGVDTPDTAVFQHNGKTAFASTIIEGGQTIQALGLTASVAEQVLEGYVADALLANWDVAGMSLDNLMVSGGKVYRIDAGGSLIFRAQGTEKPLDALVNAFEEWSSLGGTSSKGYTGQLLTFLQKAGYGDLQGFVDKLVIQGEAALKRLDVLLGKGTTAEQVAKAQKFIDSQAPTMTRASRDRIARMLVNRRELLADKVKETKDFIKASKTPPKKVKPRKGAPKTLAEVLKLPEPKPLMARTGTTPDYLKIVKEHLGEAFARMDADAKAAAYKYSGGAYKSGFNGPLRAGKETPDTKALDKAVAANRKGLEKDIMVVRKLDGTDVKSRWDRFADSHVGEVIADKAFMSTSVREGVWSGNVELRIIMREGETRYTAPGLSGGQHTGEHEFILGRGHQMVVRKVEKKAGVTVLTVDLLPEGFVLPPGTVIHYARRIWQRITGRTASH